MSIKTDSTPVEAPKPVEGSVLVDLYKLVATPAEQTAFTDSLQAGGRGYGDYKKELAAKLETYFAPMRARHDELVKNPAHVEQVLQEGGKKARALAQPTIRAARQAVGLL